MIVWLLVGLLGVVFIATGRGHARRLKAVRATPTRRSDEIAAGLDPGRAEVSGVAGPGPDGVLRAPLSGEPCVWYRVQVQKQPRKRFLSKVPAIPSIVIDQTSGRPFAVHDAAGSVSISDELAGIEGPPVIKAKEEVPWTPGKDTLAARALNLRASANLEAGVRHRYREWIIPDGSPLYALGDAGGGPDGPVLGGEALTVGAGCEGDVVRRLWRRLLVAYGGGGLMLVLGFGMTAFALYTIMQGGT